MAERTMGRKKMKRYSYDPARRTGEKDSGLLDEAVGKTGYFVIVAVGLPRELVRVETRDEKGS